MHNITTLELYQNIIEGINDGVCVVDTEYIIHFVNSQMLAINGYSEEDLIGNSIFDFVNTEDVKEIINRIERRLKGQMVPYHYYLPCKDGGVKWVTVHGHPIISEGHYRGLVISIQDNSDQKVSNHLMEENFSHYASLFENSPIPIWDEDFSQIKLAIDDLKAQGVENFRAYFKERPQELFAVAERLIVNNVNQAVVELNEAESKQYVLSHYMDNSTEDSAEHILMQILAIANNETSCEFDATLKTFKGNKRYVHLKWAVVKGHEHNYSRVYLTTTDLTSRIIEENLLLQRSNQEKAVMLREIHHRVKNNLQIISSLLKLQSNTINDQAVLEIFSASLNRISSMATVHELLYRSADFSEINYREYLGKLMDSLISTMQGKNQIIKLNMQVENINININTAVPLGLLINEIVTNSLKHGFAGIDNGEIYLSIQKINDDEFSLFIGDDGVGFVIDKNVERKETLGMSLIESLTEQLNGQLFKLDKERGTHFQLNFTKLK